MYCSGNNELTKAFFSAYDSSVVVKKSSLCFYNYCRSKYLQVAEGKIPNAGKFATGSGYADETHLLHN